MSRLYELTDKLRVMMDDTNSSVETRAAQITDDLMIQYGDLFASNPALQSIGDVAAQITSSNATEGENGVMWAEIVRLIHQLLNA